MPPDTEEAKPTAPRLGFHADEDGLYFYAKQGDNEPLKRTHVSVPISVDALTVDESGSWGKLISFRNPDGVLVETVIPLRLFENGMEVRGSLRDRGFQIATPKEAKELLMCYLQSRNPETRALLVKKPGWYDEMFVLPGEVIGGTGEKVFCDVDSHDYRTAGTLEEWRREIGSKCSGNSRLVLAVSTAFGGPLLNLSPEAEPGGFHFRSGTSTGKTTALETANSVWGAPELMETWRTTANGLESTAEKHNFGLLCLDELGQIAGRDAGDAAYQLANGQGKRRMDKTVKARKSLAWQLLFLSSGEISLTAHMREAGKKARGGQLVRVVDVPADAGKSMGVFENLHGLDHPRDLSEHLKAAAKKYFGTPIREFLRYIVKHRPDVSKMLAEAQVMLTQGHTGLNGEIYRVAKRFALVAVAGELATQAGVTSWPVGEATRGAHACFDGWLAERGLKPADSSAAVAQVRLYLEQYDSRFVTGDDKGITETHERAGFKRVIEADQVEYCIFEEVFKQRVCEGFDPKMVARALKDLGHLVSDSDHLTAKRTIPGADKVPTRLYVVRGSILAGDLEL